MGYFLWFLSNMRFDMNVIHYNETMPVQVSDTIQRRFLYTPNLMTVVVDFSGGPAKEPDPYHSHPHEQTCYIAQGEVLFFIEDEKPEHVKEGDIVAIPANKKHSIQLLTLTARLIDNFTPVREDFL